MLATKEEIHHLAHNVLDYLCGLVWNGESIGTRLKDRVSFYQLLKSTPFANTENPRSRVATSHGMDEQQLRTQIMFEDVFRRLMSYTLKLPSGLVLSDLK